MVTQLSEQASSFWNSKSSLAKAGEEASTDAFPEALGAQLKKDEKCDCASRILPDTERLAKAGEKVAKSEHKAPLKGQSAQDFPVHTNSACHPCR